MSQSAKGIGAILLACVIWGFAPNYYRALGHIPAAEVLTHRTLWTAVLFGLLLAAQGRLGDLLALMTGPMRGRVVLAALFIASNWGLFIWAIQSGHGVESSLGYYIFPLVSVLMGVVLLGERLTRVQAAAVVLAAVAVIVLTWGLGVAPWVALALAVTFAPYILVKKGLTAAATVTVTAEVVVLLPPMLIWLIWQGGGSFGHDRYETLMLPLSGILTGTPLILFSWGAQRVRLSTLGLTQYLNPTLQAFSAVVIAGEPFTIWHGIAFAMIWGALAIYSSELWRQDRVERQDRADKSRASSVATSGTLVR